MELVTTADYTPLPCSCSESFLPALQSQSTLVPSPFTPFSHTHTSRYRHPHTHSDCLKRDCLSSYL
ncbi:hypothetical protein P167DRAFT_602457 [Morchella conica CCBAS932]|uniref:Uncharacterized protein n=1 Tax=Morchella conica CCBAS932 TaxID=1392247 RepID=A0A3N4L411_9PEZI|nr:hypothetical protein P167DRAFT_602457 [Morchella conica CCBAS932]